MARTTGSPNLSNNRKAKIVAKKNLRFSTQKQIAEEEGVSRCTVNQLSEADLDPATKSLAKDYEEQFLKDLKRTNYKLLNYLEKSVDDQTLPPQAISTAFGVTFDKIQLKTGNPTEISGKDAVFIKTCRDWVTGFVEKGLERGMPATLEDALAALPKASIEVPAETRVRFIEDERRLLGTGKDG